MSNEIPAGKHLRLQVYLARCGLGSRRHCEELIRQNRVRINGQSAVLGSKVHPDDRVDLDGLSLTPVSNKIYLAVNKPSGYLCANADPQGRPLVSDLFRNEIPESLFHVGRLDFNSSGLIFFTNDGDFSYRVSHPSSGVEKEYILEAAEPIPESMLRQYRQGLRIEGEYYHLKRYSYQSPQEVLLTLEEGKNREIRRVCLHFGIRLRRIHRVRIGCVTLKNIPSGRHRPLSEKEVRWFFSRRFYDGRGDRRSGRGR